MVINFAQNDRFYIFRGQDGQEFLRGLDIVRTVPLRLRLPRGQWVTAWLALTAGDTLCLSLPCDDISNAEAEAYFDETVIRSVAQLRARHG